MYLFKSYIIKFIVESGLRLIKFNTWHFRLSNSQIFQVRFHTLTLKSLIDFFQCSRQHLSRYITDSLKYQICFLHYQRGILRYIIRTFPEKLSIFIINNFPCPKFLLWHNFYRIYAEILLNVIFIDISGRNWLNCIYSLTFWNFYQKRYVFRMKTDIFNYNISVWFMIII